jgi:hypothetical protein
LIEGSEARLEFRIQLPPPKCENGLDRLSGECRADCKSKLVHYF